MPTLPRGRTYCNMLPSISMCTFHLHADHEVWYFHLDSESRKWIWMKVCKLVVRKVECYLFSGAMGGKREKPHSRVSTQKERTKWTLGEINAFGEEIGATKLAFIIYHLFCLLLLLLDEGNNIVHLIFIPSSLSSKSTYAIIISITIIINSESYSPPPHLTHFVLAIRSIIWCKYIEWGRFPIYFSICYQKC